MSASVKAAGSSHATRTYHYSDLLRASRLRLRLSKHRGAQEAREAGQMAAARPRVYLDIDIDDWRAAYGRAVEFVEQNNLKYSLSSDDLEQLGAPSVNALLLPGMRSSQP